MNFFEKTLYMLQGEMKTPKAFGWFHLMWIAMTAFSLIMFFSIRKKYSNKQLKIVLGVYGIVALVLEILKQLIWSFNYDIVNNIVTWDYQWYAAPFQLCTTPIFVSVICLFLKDTKIRNSLLSYMAFITILGGLITIIIPDSCFVSDILINIHTMWLHCGSFVVSVYLLMSGAVKINKENLKKAFLVFLVFVVIAEILNIVVFNMGILNGETFNMFYISPYFVSTLPVFNALQENLPFVIYLITYIIAVCIGGTVVYGISYVLHRILKSKQTKYYKYIGSKVKIKIDRPLNSKHPENGMLYEVNYGYVPNEISADGDELDAYVLGIDEPIENFEGECIAVIHRTNDNDDKLIIVPKGKKYTDEQIMDLTDFQEKYFASEIIR